MSRTVGLATASCLLLLAAVGPCTAMAAEAPPAAPMHHDSHDNGHSCCEEGGAHEAQVAQCEKDCGDAVATFELRRGAELAQDLPVARKDVGPETLAPVRAPRHWLRPPPRAATSPLFVLNDAFLI